MYRIITFLGVLILLSGCIDMSQKSIKDVLNDDKLELACKAELELSVNTSSDQDNMDLNLNMNNLPVSISMVWHLSRVDYNTTLPFLGVPLTMEYSETANGVKTLYINMLGQRQEVDPTQIDLEMLRTGIYNDIKMAIQESKDINDFQNNFKKMLELDNEQVTGTIKANKIECKIQNRK